MFCYTLSFTVSLVYMVSTLGLSPFELVLVGTVLEATCFLFEVPTGIVADLYSRRLSIIIGLALVGVGFVIQGGVPFLAGVLVAQVIWGIGNTFTSGATQAWITDEIGEDAVAKVFTREQQIHLVAAFAGTIAAGALSLIDIRVPMVLSGVGFLGLALTLVFVMREEHFTPVPAAERETFRHMASTARTGLRLARTRPVVRAILVVSILAGLSSEAFDRLWQLRIIRGFDLPAVPGADTPAVWFALVALMGIVVGLAASLLVNRFGAARLADTHPNRLLALLAAVQVLGVVGVALSGSLWLALVAMWLKGAAGAIAWPVLAAWLNRNLDSRVRATVLSMDGQANAIGQVVGGPPLGLLANKTSVPVALIASALLLTPTVAIFARLRRPTAPPTPT
jgi:MFS family permease